MVSVKNLRGEGISGVDEAPKQKSSFGEVESSGENYSVDKEVSEKETAARMHSVYQ